MDAIDVKGAEELFKLGPFSITQTIISLTVVSLILIVAGILLGRNLKKRPGKVQVLTEKGVTMLVDLVVGTMGQHNIRWVPLIGTIFLSSILGSLIGMTGFLRSTTADLAVVLTWALITSVLIWKENIRQNGVLGWLKGFTEPIFIMTPMNLISEIAQPVAMAFRHFGNVAGGSIITMIIYTALSLASSALIRLIAGSVVMPFVVTVIGIVIFVVAMRKKNGPIKKLAIGFLGGMFIAIGLISVCTHFGLLGTVEIPILQFGVPAILSLYFDLFSGFVQAFVFSLLSMVYIAGACPPPEEQTDNEKEMNH